MRELQALCRGGLAFCSLPFDFNIRLPCVIQKTKNKPELFILNEKVRVCFYGGELGTRTPDPLRVMQVL